MVDPVLDPVACWEFDGDILVLHHPTTISAKYQAMGKQLGKDSDHLRLSPGKSRTLVWRGLHNVGSGLSR